MTYDVTIPKGFVPIEPEFTSSTSLVTYQIEEPRWVNAREAAEELLKIGIKRSYQTIRNLGEKKKFRSKAQDLTRVTKKSI